MMEDVGEEELKMGEAGRQGRRFGGSLDAAVEYLRPPAFERKISKRREAQEEKTIILELFKQLIFKVNEGYSRVIAIQNNKNLLTRQSKTQRPKIKQKAREPPKEQKKIQEERMRPQKKKNSAQDIARRMRAERKLQLWAKYDILMTYTLHSQEQPLPGNACDAS